MDFNTAKVGFLGAGNMACAIAGGLVAKGIVPAANIAASDISPDALKAFAEATEGGQGFSSNVELAKRSDIIVFATKPFHSAGVCDEIKDVITADKLIVTICAGLPTKMYEKRLGSTTRVVRVMPNTPALVQLGSTGVSGGANATDEDVKTVMKMFEAVGVTVNVREDQLDLITGLTGSGPAYFFRVAEALIEAGVELGLEEDKAILMVKQLLYGSGKLAATSPQSLTQLRKNVTTKGGTTEAGLKQLEEGDLSEVIFNCVKAATDRSVEFSKLGD